MIFLCSDLEPFLPISVKDSERVVQRDLILEIMLYEFEPGHRNLRYLLSKRRETRSFNKFHLGCKDNLTQSGRFQTVNSEAILSPTEKNPAHISRRHKLLRHCSRSTARGHTSPIPLYHLSRLRARNIN